MLGTVNKVLKGIFGDKTEKDIKELTPLVEQINAEFDKLKNASNDDLRANTAALRKRISEYVQSDEDKIEALKLEAEEAGVDEKEGIYDQIDEITKDIDKKLEEVLMEILPEAFANIKETARRFKENETISVTATENDRNLAATRDSINIEGDKAVWDTTWNAAGVPVTWDMVHYDVQLIGGMALHQGKIAEMQTGEGKTLVATLPVYLNALTGKGVHVVTVNDYLARRDSEWMGPLHEFHGLSVACIDNYEPNSQERRDAYLADITYGTNNEFGFDYLRDNMSSRPDQLVQRKHHYAIVDEVDSVLIDDARTPLIISGPTPKGDKHEFHQLKPRIEKLVGAQRKLITTLLSDAKRLLPKEGEDVDKETMKKGSDALLRAYRGLPKNKALIKYLSEPGIRSILQKTENHYLQDQAKEMPTIDQELFFVIDEKNNSIEMMEKGIDLISGDIDPEFFIMPDMGAEIAKIEASELSSDEQLKNKEVLMRDYAVKAERVHTINQLLKAYALFEKDVEYVVMDNKVKIVDEQTGRIMDGRRYSDGLHQAIEAKENVKVEAATQTYATVTLQNFFRMYHKLAGMTGTAETEAKEFWDIYELDVMIIPTNRPVIRKDDNDLVYKTKREKYNAIIDEVIELKEQGRPILVGTTSVEVSELLSRMLKIRGVQHNVLNAKLHKKEADIVAEAGKPGTVTIATNMAGRGTDIKLGDGVKEAGGLAIIGTERHDSRRVDRQLRGRSGRQGDPGSSQFFVSLEDDLMRLFGSERIARLMDRLGLEEGEVIQHSMVSKSIERAQKKVEENNFGIRKNLLEYDDVMNAQREAIYKKRRHALFGERLSVDIANMFYEVCDTIVNEYQEMRDFEGFNFELIRTLAIESPISEEEFNQLNPEEIAEKVHETIRNNYTKKCEFAAERALPVIKDVYENQSAQYENIVVPFTDGVRTMNVVSHLETAYTSEGKTLTTDLEKGVTLGIIDNEWKEHLREMDDLRQSVRGAVYEQKDPLLIYKLESFDLFKKMMDKVNAEIVSFLIKSNLPLSDSNDVKRAEAPSSDDMQQVQTSKAEATSVSGSSAGGGGGAQAQPQQRPQKVQPVRVEKKVGRNEPCPCGSGKKYKQCHGKA